MAKVHKKSGLEDEIKNLLASTDALLNRKKKEAQRLANKKYCLKCSDPLIYAAELCKLCFLGERKAREEARIGKQWVSTDGYWRIYDADGKIKLLHRFLVEEQLGIVLRRNQIVRHKDGDKNNNSLDNLAIEGLDLTQVICPHCMKKVTDPPQLS
jgi:HNH endonuclease